jgi:hypothetical protein
MDGNGNGEPRHDERPSRRVSLGLSRGGEMHVSLPGNPETPVDEKVIDALRTIGEATLDRMLEDAGE